MKIPQGTLNQLFQSLGEYNPVTNAAMEKIAVVLQPVAFVILGILFLLEITSHAKKFDTDQGGLTTEVYLNLAMKYVIAYAFVMSSSLIVDAIVWIGIQVGQWINSVVEITGIEDAIPALSKMKVWERVITFIFRIFAYLALILSGWVANILIFLRGIELYIIKAVAPIVVVFFVHDELRSIAVGFLKYVMAVVLQGALLILIMGLVPILTSNDYLSFSSMDGNLLENAGVAIKNIIIYVELIVKYIVVIVLLIGSQRKAKQFMGAM